MAERTRKIQIKFFVTPEEKEYILQKQKSANISSLSAYLRKMSIDGKVICTDDFSMKDFKETNHFISAVSRNINQIVKKIHGFGTVCDDDLRELKRLMEEVWQLQKSILSKLR